MGMGRESFEFRDLKSADETYTTLVYLPEPDFRFDFHAGDSWVVEYWPGNEAPGDWEETRSWDRALERVDWWLANLQRELDVGDPWADAATGELGEVNSDPRNNDPFTADEREALVGRIEQLKTHLLDAEVRSDHDRHVIIERLDYLSDAVGRLGRFDWRGLAVATVIDLGVLGYVERDTVRHVVDFLIGAVRQLLA